MTGRLPLTKALIMIVFSSVLLDRGVITAPAFSALPPMALASTMLTIPGIGPGLRGDAGED